MKVINVEIMARAKWRRVNGAFGGKGGALMMLLAGEAVISSGVKMSHDLGRWRR